MKQHSLPGQCPPNLEILEHRIRLALRRLRRRRHLPRFFFRRLRILHESRATALYGFL
ncbi:MAG: hypothetical protein ABSA70_03845 [Terriglobia bacterium]